MLGCGYVCNGLKLEVLLAFLFAMILLSKERLHGNQRTFRSLPAEDNEHPNQDLSNAMLLEVRLRLCSLSRYRGCARASHNAPPAETNTQAIR